MILGACASKPSSGNSGTTLISISVVPSALSLPKGSKQQFTATGHFNDGSSRDLTASAVWTSMNPTVATIAAGLLTAVAPGTASINAVFDSITGSATLTVNAAALVSLVVTPANPSIAKGQSQQFTAIGTLSDGSTRNLTSLVTWNSNTTSVATISTGGLVTGVAVGNTTIKAASGSINGTTLLSVMPPALVLFSVTPASLLIAKGQTQQFTATGTFTDGSMQNMTNSATWASSSTAVATISAAGLATSFGQGSTTIQAASGTVKSSATLTVGPPVLASIAVTPANPSILPATMKQLTATGSFSDGSIQDLTSTAAWASSNPSVATVSSSGLVTGVNFGSTTISATSGTIAGQTAVSISSLPAGLGWTALPDVTSLVGSGACPANQFNSDPYSFSSNCMNVIRAWSGAVADTNANRLLIWGGGHNNYYGNEIYALNLTANPITLTRVKDPTTPTNFANNGNCIDGIPPGSPDFAPNSRESYAGMAFLSNLNRMYISGGALACLQGHGSGSTWTIALENLSNATLWQHEDPSITGPTPGSIGGSYGNIADYDPNSGLLFLNDTAAMYTYNYQTNTYSQITSPQGFVTSIYLSGAIDPMRKLFVMVGGCGAGSCAPGDGVFVADISDPTSTTQQNWTAPTMADPVCAEFLAGGVNPINSANPGIAYDSVAHNFVGWPNQGNSVYIMTPDTVSKQLMCQKQTFANGPPNSAHVNDGNPNTSNGTFGRFRYFPTLDVFVVVNDWNISPYILRLR